MITGIPAFVIELGGVESDWIETHDRLQEGDKSLHFFQRNQQDWWEKNWKIRRVFDDIEKLVRKKISAGEIPPARLLDWVRLSREVKCDRATIKHEKRIAWVADRRENILKLIEGAKKEKLLALITKVKEPSELEQLKISLNSQRTQTVTWYNQCLNLESEISRLKRVISLKDRLLKQQGDELKELQEYRMEKEGTVNSNNKHLKKC
jgi:hypothetical protein